MLVFVRRHERLSSPLYRNSITPPDGLYPFLNESPSTTRCVPPMRRVLVPSSDTAPGVSARSVMGAPCVPFPAKTTVALFHTPPVIVSVSPGCAVAIAAVISAGEPTRISLAPATFDAIRLTPAAAISAIVLTIALSLFRQIGHGNTETPSGFPDGIPVFVESCLSATAARDAVQNLPHPCPCRSP